MRTYFKSSDILDDITRMILYFNLPFHPIIKERLQPVKIFPLSLAPEANTIQVMLEAFENKQN